MVTAPRLRVESLIDRKVYRVDQDIQASFGSVSDVLSAIPSVEIDADGVLSLRGDANVLVLVDGKPSAQFAGASAGENLLSLGAQDIERIEVLSTPPPQYRAEGVAGVINIVTRRRRPKGASGQVQASVGPGGREVLGASGGLHQDAWTLQASAGLRQELRQRTVRSQLDTPGSVAAPATLSRTAIDETIRRATPALTLAGDYTPDPQDRLSAALSWSDRGGLRSYTETNFGVTAGAGITASTQRQSAGHDPERDLDARLGYLHRLGVPGESLELSLHRSDSRQHEHYDYRDDTLVPPAATRYDNLGFLETHTISDAALDYVLPLAQGGVMKLGYAGQLDNYGFANAAFTIDPGSGTALVDAGLSNDFQFRQRLHAAYASWQASAEAWSWQGGARLEAGNAEAWQLTDRVYHAGEDLRIFPSLRLERTLSEQESLSLGASERITRPRPEFLNPYVDREYTPNLQAGNPLLRPQLTDALELGYEFQGKLHSHALTAYWRRNRDSVSDLTQYLGNGLTLTTRTNLPRNQAAGLEFSASGHPLPSLSANLSGNLFRAEVDASALGYPGLRSTSGLNVKLRLDWQAGAADLAQLSFTRTDRRLTPQGEIAAIDLVNLGWRHTFGPRLNAVATLSDLFNGQRFERSAATPAFESNYLRAVQGRVWYVGLVQSLGASGKDQPAAFEYEQ